MIWHGPQSEGACFRSCFFRWLPLWTSFVPLAAAKQQRAEEVVCGHARTHPKGPRSWQIPGMRVTSHLIMLNNSKIIPGS
jgi:hypothetical protein